MDQRFSHFFLEKYRLELQREARAFHEEAIKSEKVYCPNKAAQLITTGIARFIASFRKSGKSDDILIHPQRTTRQSYID